MISSFPALEAVSYRVTNSDTTTLHSNSCFRGSLIKLCHQQISEYAHPHASLCSNFTEISLL